MQPKRQETKRMKINEEQIARLEELGLMKRVKIEAMAATELNMTAMKTVTSIADRPQNIKQNPITSKTIPNNILLFWNTFQILEI